MSEEQYESFKKLVKYKKVKNINKVATESKTMYEFVMEPNKDNISNKYKFDVSNVDRQMIEKLDRLIVEQRILKKNNKIKRIKVTATALVLAVVLPKASLTIYKNDKYNESVMEEVQTKIEQIYENHPNAEINDEIRKNIYNDVISQRNENIDNYNDAIRKKEMEIKRLKEEKANLINSYYETNEENAKSK